MMSTTTLRIRNNATLTSNGTLHCHRCKPVIAIEISKTFNSVTDTAEYFGVSANTVCKVLKGKQKSLRMYDHDENGNRTRFVGTCRLTYAAHLETAMDAVMESGRKANERIAELERKAALWDAYKAEQDAIIKAKEEYEKAVIKAKEKVERRKAIEQRKQEEYQLAIARRQEAERELNELLKGDDNVA